MTRQLLFLLCVTLWPATSPAQIVAVQPPQAEKRPQELKTHGDLRVDEYFWLRNREDADVLAYLTAENDYLATMLAPIDNLQAKLAEETRARIKQSDESVPYPERGYAYYNRTLDGLQYPIYCRRKLGDASATEEVMLDVNQLAEGHEFCQVAGLDVSADSQRLAYAIDTVGRRKYTLFIKNLTTGNLEADVIQDITGNFVWAEDNQTIFYVRQDPQTLRSYQVFRHTLGTDAEEDVLVFQEDDEQFNCSVSKSRSRKYIFIESDQTLSTETRYVDALAPHSKPIVFQPRESDHEYAVDHLGDDFYIRTNWNAPNFRLMRCSQAETRKSHWESIVDHDADVFLAGFELFENYLVLEQRHNGLVRLRIRHWSTGNEHDLDFGEPCYWATSSATPDPNTDWLRFDFSSLVTPDSTFDYNMKTREKKLLKQEEVLGGFQSSDYRSERIWAVARDGVKIPVSLFYHKHTPIDGTAPCVQYGYGSYGSSMPATFQSSRLNLVDRGFVYAIAHIRGGQEMGRWWYENGKLLKKMNTFTDFIDVGRHLVANKYADPQRLYARGGSAGGLLMGAVVNLAPELYHGIIADVPFVDVVTTMLDDSIPLTTSEYDEWGNPNQKEYYDYMLSYSPYDNVRAVDYPPMLVTTGLHDSQVQYWEPAKWVARLRDRKSDDNLLVMKTNMSAGHGGASGRYDRYQEIALRDAFLLYLAGIRE